MNKTFLFILLFVFFPLFFSPHCNKNEPLMRSICSLDSTVLTGVWSRADTASQLPDTAFLDFTCSAKWFIYRVNNSVPAVLFESDYLVDSNLVLINVTGRDSGSAIVCDSVSASADFSYVLSNDSLTFSVVRDSCAIWSIFTPGSWIKHH